MAPVMREKKKKVKRLLWGMGMFLICYGSLPHSGAVVDRIVAVVNQEVITLSEIERWSRSLQEEIRTEDRLERRERHQEFLRKILDKVIEEKLIEQEAKRSGIKVTNREIEMAIEEVKQKNKLDQEALEKALAAEGLTFETFKKEMEKRILRSKFVHSAIKVEQKPGEKELAEFFEKNVDRYQVDESYRPAHILFPIPREASPEEVRRIRKRGQTVLEKIKGGADFGKMAMDYSEDTTSRKEGGDLGYFKKGELLPALEKEAMKLEIGEVSGLIRTEHGYHILKLLDRRGGGPPPFEEVKERVRADYYEKEWEKALQQFLSRLKEKSVIEIKL
ncbi:MAG: peptidylprolyl isomerase [Thermodesulfobacteriota bacterium]